MLTKADILKLAADFTDQSPMNFVPEDKAMRPELVGLRMYEYPIMRCAAAADPFFEKLKEPGIVGPHSRNPDYWLPGAKSVVTFFFPFTDQVIVSNREDKEWPSAEWLHARIEGQAFLGAFCLHLVDALRADGHAAMTPLKDPRFSNHGSVPVTGKEHEGPEIPQFNSNWSERHVAFIAGLGTFCLSKGMITEKGVAGRFASVITDLPLEADQRPYTEYDEYCSKCGACIRRCPAQAISLEHAKAHTVCSPYVSMVKKRFSPYYGCAKCNVAVPCERKIPPRRKSA